MTAPQWHADGILTIRGDIYRGRKAALQDTVRLVEGLAGGSIRSAGELERLWELVAAGSDIAASLLSAAKAAQTLQAKNSLAPAERTDVLTLREALEEAAAKALEKAPAALLAHPTQALRSLMTVAGCVRRRHEEIGDRRIEEPLAVLYAHLKSGMKLTFETVSGPSVLSASSAESLLKLTENHAFRRRLFGAYNAWFAENASAFP